MQSLCNHQCLPLPGSYTALNSPQYDDTLNDISIRARPELRYSDRQEDTGSEPDYRMCMPRTSGNRLLDPERLHPQQACGAFVTRITLLAIVTAG